MIRSVGLNSQIVAYTHYLALMGLMMDLGFLFEDRMSYNEFKTYTEKVLRQETY
jgi:hypothetical protein